MKSKGTAYLLWILSLFGWLGFQHFYVGKYLKGIIWILTGGVFGIGALIDLFTMGTQVENYNITKELNVIRQANFSNIKSRNSNEEVHENQQKVSKEISPSKFEIKVKQVTTSILNFFKSNKRNIINFGLPILAIGLLVRVAIFYLNPDFTDPKKLINKTESLWRKGDFKTYYYYFSEKTKSTYSSFEDFISKGSIPDSILNRMELISSEISLIDKPFYEDFRLFKVKSIEKTDNLIDTSTYFRVAIRENDKWKLVWDRNILKKSKKYFLEGDFIKSIELCEEAIRLNPFSQSARERIIWSYIRTEQKPSNWGRLVESIIEELLELDSTNSDAYNAIGSYYSYVNQNEKAVQNFLFAVKHEKDSSVISLLYANASQSSKNYNPSLSEKYLEESLIYNEKSSFAWQTFGDLLYKSKKFNQAKEKYFRAIELIEEDNNLDNHSLINLYGSYALTCQKLDLKEEAQKYIIKCIRVYPDKTHPIFKELNL